MKIFASKKKRFIFIGALILLVLTLVVVFIILSNKNKNSGTDSNTGLEQGFNVQSSGEEENPLKCAYQSDKNEFDINDVALDFYFGTIYNNSQLTSIYTDYELYLKHEGQEKVLVKKVNESLFDKKYSCHKSANGKYQFDHSEKITIPENVFVNDSGKISITVLTEDYYDGKLDSLYAQSVDVYYRKSNDNRIVLSVNKAE